MYTWQSGSSSRISMARFAETVQQIFEHHSRPICRSREPTPNKITTRSGLRPSAREPPREVPRAAAEAPDARAGMHIDKPVLLDPPDHAADGILGPLARR